METPPEPPTPDAPRRGVPRLAIFAIAAIVAGVGLAWALRVPSPPTGLAPTSGEGRLVIDTTAAEDSPIDATLPLRCFVQGKFVGETLLVDCARRNGVAPDAMDVGLDPSGALVAEDPFAPDPNAPGLSGDTDPPAPEALAGDEADPGTDEVQRQACQIYSAGRWRRAPADMALNTCVHLLFNGHCEPAGAAAYGRWGPKTLRLVAGRIEISDDNKTFKTLAAQGADCSVE